MRNLTKGVGAAALLLSFVYAASQAEAQTNIGKITQGGTHNSATVTSVTSGSSSKSKTSISQTTTGSPGKSKATVTHAGKGSYSININQDGARTKKSGKGNKTVTRRSRR